jgi:hypothetical protein
MGHHHTDESAIPVPIKLHLTETLIQSDELSVLDMGVGVTGEIHEISSINVKTQHTLPGCSVKVYREIVREYNILVKPSGIVNDIIIPLGEQLEVVGVCDF